MTEDRKPTPHEIAEKEEYASLFNKARADIELMTIDEAPNNYNLGRKELAVELGRNHSRFSFYWNEKDHVFGIKFSRGEGKLVGYTSYNFHLEDSVVDLTGDVGDNFGNESWPYLIYAPESGQYGALEKVRHAPLNVDFT
jgi:hypothetical protein